MWLGVRFSLWWNNQHTNNTMGNIFVHIVQKLSFSNAVFCTFLNLLFTHHAVSGQYRVVVISRSWHEPFWTFIRAISRPSRHVCFSVSDALSSISFAASTSSLTIAETQGICFGFAGKIAGFEVALWFEIIVWYSPRTKWIENKIWWEQYKNAY